MIEVCENGKTDGADSYDELWTCMDDSPSPGGAALLDFSSFGVLDMTIDAAADEQTYYELLLLLDDDYD